MDMPVKLANDQPVGLAHFFPRDFSHLVKASVTNEVVPEVQFMISPSEFSAISDKLLLW